MTTPFVAVVGSANVDIVVPVKRHPKPGETLLGGELKRYPGGKGANQAVGAGRAGGARVHFIGGLGLDDAADLLLESMQAASVCCSEVARTDHPTGTALIWVTPEGGNTIIVAPGANQQFTISPEAAGVIRAASAVLAQLEVPLAVVTEAARLATGSFILNAAPSRELPKDLLDRVDVLVVNEHEAADLTGSPGEPAELVHALLEVVPAVVLTLGGDGALVGKNGGELSSVAPFAVDPVDTTGAGDTFCGVLAAEIARGSSLVEAAVVASAAGALSTTRHGAQSSVPDEGEVRKLARTAWQ